MKGVKIMGTEKSAKYAPKALLWAMQLNNRVHTAFAGSEPVPP